MPAICAGFHICRSCPISYTMLEFLPPRIGEAVRHLDLGSLYELRIRAEKPLAANIGGVYCWLARNGPCERAEHAIVPTGQEVEDAVFAASGYSVYSVADQLRQGFLTGACGERIGVCGTFVYEGGSVLSVRAVTSLCVRIPHTVEGCAEAIYARCLSDKLRSVLILSPPGEGKTTMLRDLARLVSVRRSINILVSDERGELSAGDLGRTADVIRHADKLTAFTAGIRAMRPDLIVTDELLPEDYAAVRRAMEGGVCVFASAHLKRVCDVPQKLFERYVLLDGVGRVGAVCGADGNALA